MMRIAWLHSQSHSAHSQTATLPRRRLPPGAIKWPEKRAAARERV